MGAHAGATRQPGGVGVSKHSLHPICTQSANEGRAPAVDGRGKGAERGLFLSLHVDALFTRYFVLFIYFIYIVFTRTNKEYQR